MNLYVNGDSHTAGAEAVNPHAFAEDDPKYEHLKRLPHPDNLAVSWGKKLSNMLKMGFVCDAESGSSNTRIIRTTKEFFEKQKQPEKYFVIIQWSTWEREEWLIDDTYYQINGSGIDIVPESHKQQYKEYVANINWKEKTRQAHKDVIELHKWLQEKNIKHIFFNANSDFTKVQKVITSIRNNWQIDEDRYDFGLSYLEPYTDLTYHKILTDKGIQTVSSHSYHFGEDGHSVWANHMLKYIVKNKLL